MSGSQDRNVSLNSLIENNLTCDITGYEIHYEWTCDFCQTNGDKAVIPAGSVIYNGENVVNCTGMVKCKCDYEH